MAADHEQLRTTTTPDANRAGYPLDRGRGGTALPAAKHLWRKSWISAVAPRFGRVQHTDRTTAETCETATHDRV